MPRAVVGKLKYLVSYAQCVCILEGDGGKRAIRIGIAWSVQQLPPITPDPWDVPLHAIATEQEWISIMDPTA